MHFSATLLRGNSGWHRYMDPCTTDRLMHGQVIGLIDTDNLKQRPMCALWFMLGTLHGHILAAKHYPSYRNSVWHRYKDPYIHLIL